MGRAPCCEKVGLKRGPWTPEEDDKLVSFINEHGHGSWRALPKKAGLLRCGKSCRLRWTNYLRPDIKRGEFSPSEENAILQLHALLGNRWSAIAAHLPKRTDNEIKNYWNTHLKKKLMKMGLDPITHKPLADSILMDNSGDAVIKSSVSGEQRHENLNGNSSNVKSNTLGSADTVMASVKSDEEKKGRLLLRGSSSTPKGSSATMHLTQWESVRLEAEARLTQEAKMRAKGMWRRNELKPSACAGGGPNLVKASSFHEAAAAAAAAAGSIGHSVGALKSVSAVELMHALHNWEKSLQGQAGLLWPEPWRAAAATTTQNSCGGHSTESSSSSSPPAIAAPAAPTSSSRQPPIHSDQHLPAAGSRPHSPPRKLSWSDALVMPPKYTKAPTPTLTPTPTPHDLCKLDQGSRRNGSFSSLMLDAVLGKSLVQAYHVPGTVDPPHDYGSKEELGSSDVKMKNVGAADNDSSDKHHLDEASNVSAVTGDMQDDEACTGGGGGEEDDSEEQSVSADGTSDLFKDLPKLKRDANTTSVSYTALLSEEISDYWSNIVLKEQVASPTIHITF